MFGNRLRFRLVFNKLELAGSCRSKQSTFSFGFILCSDEADDATDDVDDDDEEDDDDCCCVVFICELGDREVPVELLYSPSSFISFLGSLFDELDDVDDSESLMYSRPMSSNLRFLEADFCAFCCKFICCCCCNDDGVVEGGGGSGDVCCCCCCTGLIRLLLLLFVGDDGHKLVMLLFELAPPN